jgi:prevent-host-death family protein
MLVTAAEFKNNIGKYLSIVSDEDVFITKNGKNIAKLSMMSQDKAELTKSTFGVITLSLSLEKGKEEMLTRNESVD